MGAYVNYLSLKQVFNIITTQFYIEKKELNLCSFYLNNE